MTPEAQRIAIAEACGFVELSDEFYCDGRAWLKGEQRIATCDLPDYLNDLNEMHEVEKILNEPQRLWFMRYLIPDDSFDIGNRVTNGMVWNVAHATAAKRAEAFLMTLGKWVD